MTIGVTKQQKAGYKAFIPNRFPPPAGIPASPALILKHSRAERQLGKLDGATRLLPDVDFFLFMYIRKDAASSSQIEGTQATMMDVIESEAGTADTLPPDVDDIHHYIRALNYGLLRLRDLPMSLRFIRELHRELMEGARHTHFSDPGEFRRSQNWIGGATPANARYVPPPPAEMMQALSDLERFLQAEDEYLPLIKLGLIHAQFETIHPFLDGNGRTGRLLITLYLWMTGLLEKPVLFLSSYFRKHQSVYYDRLDGYHHGKIDAWIEFLLDGIIETAGKAITTAQRITDLRQMDMDKVQGLGKRSSESAVAVLRRLYALPIVNADTIMRWSGFTAPGARRVIHRFIDLGILEQKDPKRTYGRSYIYRRYVDIFLED